MFADSFSFVLTSSHIKIFLGQPNKLTNFSLWLNSLCNISRVHRMQSSRSTLISRICTSEIPCLGTYTPIIPRLTFIFPLPLLVTNVHGVSSTKDDPIAPLTSGFFRVDKGGKTTATYAYYEVKIIVEGDLIVSDGTGQKVNAVRGDVLYFPKGATSKSFIILTG